MTAPATVYAGAVLLGEIGILVRGASGSGKSSLLLALLDADPAAARLIADDRVILTAVHGRLLADAPPELAGLLEVRGVGLLRVPYVAPAVVRMIVDLVPLASCPRLPEESEARTEIDGVPLPRLFLPVGFAGSATRIRLALRGLFGPAA